MLHTYLTFSLAVLLPRLLPWTHEEPKLPDGLPPEFCLARAAEVDGRVTLYLTRVRWVFREHNTWVMKDGKEVTEKHTERCSVAMASPPIVVDGKDVRVSTSDGWPVDAKELPKLLEKPTQVLLFVTGEVDPFYLKVVRVGTPIVTAPYDVVHDGVGEYPKPPPKARKAK